MWGGDPEDSTPWISGKVLSCGRGGMHDGQGSSRQQAGSSTREGPPARRLGACSPLLLARSSTTCLPSAMWWCGEAGKKEEGCTISSHTSSSVDHHQGRSGQGWVWQAHHCKSFDLGKGIKCVCARQVHDGEDERCVTERCLGLPEPPDSPIIMILLL